MAPTLPTFNPARLRSYIFRLPLFTRIVLLLIVAFWILELQSAWDVIQWGGLIPREIGLGTSMWLSSKANMALQFDLRKVEANISACHSVPP
jgi:glycosylphosphatidylinositol transamidase